MTTTEYNDREALRQEIVELRQDYEEKKSRVNYLHGQLADTRKERDKYRDMADRRQGQFDRLKAACDEITAQRDDANESLKWARYLITELRKRVPESCDEWDRAERIARQSGEGECDGAE